jgi:hypothetical protein
MLISCFYIVTSKPLSGAASMTERVAINMHRVRHARLLKGPHRQLLCLEMEEYVIHRVLISKEIDMTVAEKYLFHLVVPETGYILLLTNRRCVFLESPLVGPVERASSTKGEV